MTPFRGWNWFRTEFLRLVGTVIRSRTVGRQMAVVETWMEVRRLAFSDRPSTGISMGRHETSWWCHQMETFSVLQTICAGNSPVTGEFPSQRPVTQSFDVFCDLRLNKRLSKQSWGSWFETLSRPLWRHDNVDLDAPVRAVQLPSFSINYNCFSNTCKSTIFTCSV